MWQLGNLDRLSAPVINTGPKNDNPKPSPEQKNHAQYTSLVSTILNTCSVVWNSTVNDSPLPFFQKCLENEDGTMKQTAAVRFLGWDKGLISKDYLLVADQGLFKKILKHENNDPQGTCSGGEIYKKTERVTGKNIVTVEKEEHKKLRTFARPFFTSAYVKAQEKKIKATAELEVQSWIESETEINVSRELPRYTSRVIANILLGYDKNPGDLPQCIETLTDYIYKLMHGIPIIPSLEKNEIFLEKKQVLKEIVEVVLNRPLNPESKTMIDQMKRNGFSPEDIEGMINVVFIGGQETTAKLLTFIFYYLCEYPEWQETLYKEMNDPQPVLESDPKLSRLEAFICEVARRHPPAYGQSRTLNKPLDLLGNNQPFPEGTQLILLHAMAQMNPANWVNPHSFHPDRFLKKNDSPFRTEQKLMLFGTGPNKCLGSNYVLPEIEAILKALLRKASIEFAKPNDGRQRARFMLDLAEDLVIKITPRNQKK